MRNTIIVTILLMIAVIGASIYYFSSINSDQQSASKAFAHLPASTLLIVETKNDETNDNIFKDFEVFDALIGFEQAANYDYLKNHLLRNKHLAPLVYGTEMFISFHAKNKNIETLFTLPLIEKIDKSELHNLIKNLEKDFTIRQQDTLEQTIFTFAYGAKDSVIYGTLSKKTLFASASKELLIEVIDPQIPRLAKEQIEYFNKNNSKNTPLSVYFPHQHFDALTSLFKRNNPGDFLKQFKGLSGSSAWNINFKQDALMLSGESYLSNKEGNYIALFSQQTKTSQRLYTYFPSNTAFFMEYSVSDKALFQSDLRALFTQRNEQNSVQKPKEEWSTTAQTLEQSLGKEFAIVELNNRTYLGYVSISDSKLWNKFVNQGTEVVGDSIYRFRESNLLYNFYGDGLKPFTRPYIYKTDDVIVVSNELSNLRDYIKNYKNKNLLTGTLGFKNFEKLVGNEANVTFFAHSKNAENTLINTLSSNYSKNFRNKQDYGYQDFYGWSVQLSGNQGVFLSKVYAVYKSKNTLGSNPDWKYEFNNRLITQPYVFEHSDTSQFILVQEQDHTVHAISPRGKKMWSSVFSGRIVGDVIQLDDRSLVAVTDRQRLYRFDPTGKNYPGFSKDMGNTPTSTATVGMLAGEQVLLIPTAKQILAFQLDGSKVENWPEQNVAGEIIGDIHVVGESFIVGTSFGRVYVFDQEGKISKEFDAPGDVVFRNPIGILRANDAFTAIAADSESRIYRFNLNKATVVKQMPEWNTNYMANFVNIQSSAQPELIIVNQSQLQVYELADSIRLSYSYSFTKDITNRPQYFKADAGLYRLGISSRATNLIYLFGENGNLEEGFPVEALPLFYYGKINYNSGNYLLCSRRDHTLYAYPH